MFDMDIGEQWFGGSPPKKKSKSPSRATRRPTKTVTRYYGSSTKTRPRQTYKPRPSGLSLKEAYGGAKKVYKGTKTTYKGAKKTYSKINKFASKIGKPKTTQSRTLKEKFKGTIYPKKWLKK